MRSRSSVRAPGSASNVTGSPVILITVKMVRLRMKSVTSAYRVRRRMNRVIISPQPASQAALELDFLPRIGISGGKRGGKHVLPFLGGDARSDAVHEGMAEHRDEIGILQNLALDSFRQLLALGRFCRAGILLNLLVEALDADCVGAEATAAFEQRLVPVGPGRANAGAHEDDVGPGPGLQTGLTARV